jgi:hypothetical protein
MLGAIGEFVRIGGWEVSSKFQVLNFRRNQNSAISQCEFASSRAVPGTVHRWKTSRLRRLPVLAVGVHRWIENGEPFEDALRIPDGTLPIFVMQ